MDLLLPLVYAAYLSHKTVAWPWCNCVKDSNCFGPVVIESQKRMSWVGWPAAPTPRGWLTQQNLNSYNHLPLNLQYILYSSIGKTIKNTAACSITSKRLMC